MRRILMISSMCLLAGCQGNQQNVTKPVSPAEALVEADRHISSTADALLAIDQAREVVAENLRHVDVAGYKAKIARVNGKVMQITLNLEQGGMETTSRPFDIAISGNGFFRVKTESIDGPGLAYTRNGNFFVNNQSELVIGMGDGFRLDPPITIPANANDVTISQSGVVTVLVAGNIKKQAVGQINLYSFVNPAGLIEIGPALYVQTNATGEPIESRPQTDSTGSLMQGFLEKSNVQMDRERMRDDFLKKWRSNLVQVAER